MALLDALLDESVDDGTTLLACVCVCCGPPSLLALTRCSTRLRRAVAAPLQQAEQQSAAKVTEHIGKTLEQMAGGGGVSWRAGLPLAQCRHLGVWLRLGNPLQRVPSLRLDHHRRTTWITDLHSYRPQPDRPRAVSRLHLADKYRLDDEMMTILSMLIAVNPQVTSIDCTTNRIADAGAAAIANAIAANDSITILNLGASRIGDAGAAAIANAITANSSITELSLGSNIGDVGAAALASSLAATASITILNLGGNEIGDAGAIAIANALAVDTSMTELYLGNGNNIGDTGAAAIAKAIEANTSLVLSLLDVDPSVGRNLAIAAACRIRGVRVQVGYWDLQLDDSE